MAILPSALMLGLIAPIMICNHRKILRYCRQISGIWRAEIKHHIYYPQIKDDKGIFNDHAFYDSDAARRYDTLSKPKLWHILVSLLGYALILFSVQLVPWGAQYLHFSSEMEFGKLLVYCLPVPIIIAFVIILRS